MEKIIEFQYSSSTTTVHNRKQCQMLEQYCLLTTNIKKYAQTFLTSKSNDQNGSGILKSVRNFVCQLFLHLNNKRQQQNDDHSSSSTFPKRYEALESTKFVYKIKVQLQIQLLCQIFLALCVQYLQFLNSHQQTIRSTTSHQEQSSRDRLSAAGYQFSRLNIIDNMNVPAKRVLASFYSNPDLYDQSLLLEEIIFILEDVAEMFGVTDLMNFLMYHQVLKTIQTLVNSIDLLVKSAPNKNVYKILRIFNIMLKILPKSTYTQLVKIYSDTEVDPPTIYQQQIISKVGLEHLRGQLHLLITYLLPVCHESGLRKHKKVLNITPQIQSQLQSNKKQRINQFENRKQYQNWAEMKLMLKIDEDIFDSSNKDNPFSECYQKYSELRDQIKNFSINSVDCIKKLIYIGDLVLLIRKFNIQITSQFKQNKQNAQQNKNNSNQCETSGLQQKMHKFVSDFVQFPIQYQILPHKIYRQARNLYLVGALMAQVLLFCQLNLTKLEQQRKLPQRGSLSSNKKHKNIIQSKNVLYAIQKIAFQTIEGIKKLQNSNRQQTQLNFFEKIVNLFQAYYANQLFWDNLKKNPKIFVQKQALMASNQDTTIHLLNRMKLKQQSVQKSTKNQSLTETQNGYSYFQESVSTLVSQFHKSCHNLNNIYQSSDTQTLYQSQQMQQTLKKTGIQINKLQEFLKYHYVGIRIKDQSNNQLQFKKYYTMVKQFLSESSCVQNREQFWKTDIVNQFWGSHKYYNILEWQSFRTLYRQKLKDVCEINKKTVNAFINTIKNQTNHSQIYKRSNYKLLNYVHGKQQTISQIQPHKKIKICTGQ